MLKPRCATRLLASLFMAGVAGVSTVACSDKVVDPSIAPETLVVPFDVDDFEAINPEPAIRGIDMRIDTGFDEREKLPRDAISPVYTPKYVAPDDSPISDEELVMGIAINGEARAMPVGLMRFREMVNDVIGGVPILATW